MCGRYALFYGSELKDTAWMAAVRRLDPDSPNGGEISPSLRAPAILRRDVKMLRWGFPRFAGDRLIINARAETAAQKRLFQRSLLHNRCLIPASGYYEWRERQKYYFTSPDQPILYMAGLYREFGRETCFVILTVAANASVAEIHGRMPLILPKDRLEDWLAGDQARICRLLRAAPPALACRAAVSSRAVPLF